MSAFITPLTNRRTDAYGGSLENRMRFPLEVYAAVRAAWPAGKPISVRISANDWVGADGVTPADAVEIARLLQAAGVDIIDVSAGQTSQRRGPSTAACSRRRSRTASATRSGIATMAVGNIYEPDHVNSILMAGRADLCCLARPHLADPYWTLHAAAALGYTGATWPKPYLAGRDQLHRLAVRPNQPRRRCDAALAGRHALITGGGSGIGAAIARTLAGAAPPSPSRAGAPGRWRRSAASLPRAKASSPT